MRGIAGMAGTWTKDGLWPLCSLFSPSGKVLSVPKSDGTDCHCVPMQETEETNMSYL